MEKESRETKRGKGRKRERREKKKGRKGKTEKEGQRKSENMKGWHTVLVGVSKDNRGTSEV